MFLIAVHIADGVLRPEWLVTGWLITLFGVSLSLRHLSPDVISRLALAAAAFFVASSLHFPVGIGRVHLLLTGLVGVLAGDRSILVVFVGLVLQLLLLGHGGLTTLGVNTIAMGMPAILVGRLAARGVNGFVIGVLGVALTLLVNGAAIYLGAVPEVRSASLAFILVHIPVAAVEGFVTLASLRAIRVTNGDQLSGKTSSSGTSH